jgi:hypothetical protein
MDNIFVSKTEKRLIKLIDKAKWKYSLQ